MPEPYENEEKRAKRAATQIYPVPSRALVSRAARGN